MAAAYPSGFNTFVPSFDASGHIVVAYSRNPKDFSVTQYTTITPVKRSIGYYLRITAEQAARMLQSNGADRIWADGQEAPHTNSRLESFNFVPFNTLRYVYDFALGYKTQEQADWKILASHAAISAQNAMTFRTQFALGVLTTSGNYDTGHVQTATAWGGGKWNAGTVSNPYIKRGLLAAAYKINQDTLGAVGPRDLILVMSPNTAQTIAATEELQDAFKQSSYTPQWYKGEEVKAGRWGLPEYLWGFKVIVEDCQMVTSTKSSTKVIAPALADGTVLLLARPGGLTSMEGASSYSTGHFFSYEEMTVETKDDPDNRRTSSRLVDDFDFQVVAPSSGCVLTACI